MVRCRPYGYVIAGGAVLDVVDNVWVALWFACHTAHSYGKHDEYLHFEKRVVRHTNPDESFA